jgi:hypothetical protein
MPVWRGAATGALSGVKKNAVILLRWLPNFDYVTVMLPVLLCRCLCGEIGLCF